MRSVFPRGQRGSFPSEGVGERQEQMSKQIIVDFNVGLFGVFFFLLLQLSSLVKLSFREKLSLQLKGFHQICLMGL